MTNLIRDKIKSDIISILSVQQDIEKIVLFGSFLSTDSPNDIDIAIYSNSNNDYLTLALKYRKLLRDVSKVLPIDVIPVKNNKGISFFDNEINKGEIIYEKRN